jgi:hypothetical protein
MTLDQELRTLKSDAHSFEDAPSPMETLALVKSGAPYEQMFFENLSDPQWLPVLRDTGHFSTLPEKEQRPDGTTIYPRSLQLRGLLNLVSNAPEEALKILEDLPASSNPNVIDQIMRCIAAINLESLIPRCSRVVKRRITLDSGSHWVWIDEILRLWFELGRFDESIELLSTHIDSLISQRKDRYGSGDGWQFSEIDRNLVEPLIKLKPVKMAGILFNSLLAWKSRDIKLSSADPTLIEKSLSEDSVSLDHGPSSYWLEDFRLRTSRIHELEEILATRLFEIGTSIFKNGEQSTMREFDELLRSDTWELFTRLRWQLYADHPEKTLEWARTDFIPRVPILGHFEGSHSFEMAQMLEAHSKKHGDRFLSPSEVEQAYSNVMAGPIDHDGNRDSDERFIQVFYRRQLHPIQNLLAGPALDTYEKLSADKPELPVSSYKPFSSGGEARTIEHVAPKQADGMASMPAEDLWLFLNTWKPEGNRHESDHWWVEEHISALGTKFADLIVSDPDRFQASTEWWKRLTRPVILYQPLDHAIKRISKEAKEDSNAGLPPENEWRNWFGLADWISIQGGTATPTDSEANDTVRSEDKDWNWSRIMAVKFLGAAITPRYPVPDGLKPEIGRLLRKFLEDPDPRLAAKDKPMLQDWLTTAINSVRGTAIENLLELALKQKRDSPVGQAEDWIWDLFHTALLKEDQSPAVYAIMGARLNLALYIYGDRFKQEPHLLLPVDRATCRDAFLLAQVRYGNALGDLLEVLPAYPAAALDFLAELNSQEMLDHEQLSGDFGGRLGTHLAFYFWNDLFPGREAAEHALDRYFDLAQPSQRSRAIGDIARIFSEAQPIEENKSLYHRVQKLWDRRFAVIEEKRANNLYTAGDVHDELSAFVKWLGCECHPFGWRHDRVLRAIKILDTPVQPAFTMRTLESLSRDPEKLAACTEILEALLSKETQIVSWAYSDREMKPILVRGLGSEDTAIKERTLRIQEILLRHGLFEYLDLNVAPEN